MSKPSKRDVLDFLRYLKKDWQYKDHSLGYDLISFLQEFVKNNYGGKNNGTKEARHKKP